MIAMLVQDDFGIIHLDPTHDNAQPCYGPPSQTFQQVYWSSQQRQEDLQQTPGKPADETDTSADESDDIPTSTSNYNNTHTPTSTSNYSNTHDNMRRQQAYQQQQPTNKQLDQQDTKNKQVLQHRLHSKLHNMMLKRTGQAPTDLNVHKQGLSRQEQKALDREIPWRTILAMPPAYVDKFLAAVEKEFQSWQEWNSVEPLTDDQVKDVMENSTLARRILPARACYRDKACGIGEVQAKCRIVALGHLDPDLAMLSRNAGTPSRSTEQVMYAMLVAGYNQELFDTKMSWTAWTGDASTAFLQGRNPDRKLPLFLRPPKDGLIEMTNTWKAKLYRVLGNVYGLADAPATWSREVADRLRSVGFVQHDFDKQMYILRRDDQIVAIVIVYVDDFLGLSRSDHALQEVHDLFKWGSLNHFEENKPILFKGKEITLIRSNGRYRLHITLKKFLEGIDFGMLPRGRLQQSPELSMDERKELRSISGCLQWAATQTRPEVAALVSLSGHGEQATIEDLKRLHAAVKFLKETPEYGITIMDVPFGYQTMLLGYSDSSWANAKKSGSQIGVMVGITTASVKDEISPFTLIDWRSARSPRVCRSTLAAEATAADECADRLSYVNHFVSELLYGKPAHKVGCRLSVMQAVDAKSLFDAIMSENPNLTDKRTLVNIRAIQETISNKEIRWVPTRFQFSDGLTKIDERLMETFRRWLESPFAVLSESSQNGPYEQYLFPQGAKKKSTSENCEQHEGIA